MLSWTAGLPKSIKKNENWVIKLEITSETKERAIAPCVLAVANGTCVIRNWSIKEAGRNLLTLNTAKAALAKAALPALTQNVARQVSAFPFRFFFLNTKPLLAETIAKVPKLRLYRPKLTFYPVKLWAENLGPWVETAREIARAALS